MTITFNPGYKENYTDEQLIDAIYNSINNGKLWILNENEIRNIIAFEIWANKGLGDFSYVTEDEIHKRINELRTQVKIASIYFLSENTAKYDLKGYLSQ